jgi:hypothetical protein
VQGRDDERDAEEGEFQLAINPAQPEAPVSEADLGVLLRRQGDAAGAKAAYERAVDSGHPEAGAEAAYRGGAACGEPDAVVLLEALRQGRG